MAYGALAAAPGYWYLATPYTNYPDGIGLAALHAAEAAAALLSAGVAFYCPIAMTHPIAIAGALDPKDAALYEPLNMALMKRAWGCVVVEMPGWRESAGVSCEIAYFSKRWAPVRYLTWPDLRLRYLGEAP